MGPKKKRNPNDLTGRNLHALKKALKKIEDRMKFLEVEWKKTAMRLQALNESLIDAGLILRSNKGK